MLRFIVYQQKSPYIRFFCSGPINVIRNKLLFTRSLTGYLGYLNLLFVSISPAQNHNHSETLSQLWQHDLFVYGHTSLFYFKQCAAVPQRVIIGERHRKEGSVARQRRRPALAPVICQRPGVFPWEQQRAQQSNEAADNCSRVTLPVPSRLLLGGCAACASWHTFLWTLVPLRCGIGSTETPGFSYSDKVKLAALPGIPRCKDK